MPRARTANSVPMHNSSQSPQRLVCGATCGKRSSNIRLQNHDYATAEYCDAYLLRAALLKSYSGRISSAPTGAASTQLTVFDLVGSFFIVPFLPSSCLSRTDHANLTIALSAHAIHPTTPVFLPSQNDEGQPLPFRDNRRTANDIAASSCQPSFFSRACLIASRNSRCSTAGCIPAAAHACP